MNKKELIVAAAAAAEMTQKDVEAALKGLIEATIATVAAKGKVQLIGFGTFEARERAARTGKNLSKLPLLLFLLLNQAKLLKKQSM